MRRETDSRKLDLLIGAVKRKSDLKLLYERHSYRIPLRKIKPDKVSYIAFYLPSRVFGGSGRIESYGRVDSYRIAKRKFIPNYSLSCAGENEMYVNFYFRRIIKLKSPVMNSSSMRVSFKKSDSRLLKKSGTLALLYGINPLEEMMNEKLKRSGMKFRREYAVNAGGKKYRLDFAFFCRNGILGLECDSKKWHSSKRRAEKDRERDSNLLAEGIHVIRLNEEESMMDAERIKEIISIEATSLGGIIS